MSYSKRRQDVRKKSIKYSKKYNIEGGADVNDCYNMLKNVLKVLRCQYPRAYRQAVLTQNVSHSEYDVMLPWTMFPGDVERITDRDGQNRIVPKPGDKEIIDTNGTRREKGW